MRAISLLLLALAACTRTAAGPERHQMTDTKFARYVALGDSIQIDLYPAADVARRHAGKASTDALGAASLLHRNDDKLWPEFKGRDLRSLYDGIELDDLTADGATTQSLLRQVEQVRASDEPTVMTITAGGNDLLGEIGFRGWGSGSAEPWKEIAQRLRESVGRLLELRPNSVIVVGTVYDPSDGTNRLPGYSGSLDREAEWLREYNGFVRTLVASDKRLRLADIQKHFHGHGLTAKERDRWYLQESIIEPNARGASEVRRLFLEAIEKR